MILQYNKSSLNNFLRNCEVQFLFKLRKIKEKTMISNSSYDPMVSAIIEELAFQGLDNLSELFSRFGLLKLEVP